MRTTGIHTQMEDVRRPRTPMTTAARARGGEVSVSQQKQQQEQEDEVEEEWMHAAFLYISNVHWRLRHIRRRVYCARLVAADSGIGVRVMLSRQSARHVYVARWTAADGRDG